MNDPFTIHTVLAATNSPDSMGMAKILQILAWGHLRNLPAAARVAIAHQLQLRIAQYLLALKQEGFVVVFLILKCWGNMCLRGDRRSSSGSGTLGNVYSPLSLASWLKIFDSPFLWKKAQCYESNCEPHQK